MIRVRPARETDAAYVAATALKQVGRFVRGVDREELALTVRAMLNASHIVVARVTQNTANLCCLNPAMNLYPCTLFC